jgi:uncharacterized protein (TIGR02145 family)
MKLKNILYNLAIIVFIAAQLYAQNTNPVVSNVAFSISGTTVTVTYDVYDAEQDVFTISMFVSSDNGSTWNFDYGTATGDIRTGITEGNNKTIQWTYYGGYNQNFKIRIYATDETADGSPCPGVPSIVYGNSSLSSQPKTYNTIQIGTQCWLKENLLIGKKQPYLVDYDYFPTIDFYCYDESSENCMKYGGLYQWAEAMQNSTTPGAQGICPPGWHIPTDSEFETLKQAVKFTTSSNAMFFRLLGVNELVGVDGDNTSGFSALTGGYYNSDLSGIAPPWEKINYSFYLWTSNGPIGSSSKSFYNFTIWTNRTRDGLGVRCLKD